MSEEQKSERKVLKTLGTVASGVVNYGIVTILPAYWILTEMPALFLGTAGGEKFNKAMIQFHSELINFLPKLKDIALIFADSGNNFFYIFVTTIVIGLSGLVFALIKKIGSELLDLISKIVSSSYLLGIKAKLKLKHDYEMAKLDNEKSEARGQVEATKQELKSKEDELATKSERLAVMEFQVKQSEANKIKAENEAKTNEEKTKEQNKKYIELKKKLDELYKMAQESIKQTQEERIKSETLKSESDDLKNKISQSKIEAKDAEKKAEQLRVESENLKKDLDGFEAKISRSELEAKKAEDKRVESENRMKESERLVLKAQKEKDLIESEKKILESQRIQDVANFKVKIEQIYFKHEERVKKGQAKKEDLITAYKKKEDEFPYDKDKTEIIRSLVLRASDLKVD